MGACPRGGTGTERGVTFDTDFEDALATLDTRLFGHIKTQTSELDRISLLALHSACREAHGSFAYLEVGSYVGGSLQVLVADPRCVSITSIDSRPASAPDVRGASNYRANTTARMLEALGSVPDADLTKLHTIEAETSAVVPEDVNAPQLCLIDGEHTYEAVLDDARFCRRVVREQGAIVFHDRRLIRTAIEHFLDEIGDVTHEGYALLGQIYVVELGPTRLRPAVERLLAGHPEPKPFLADHPRRRHP
jgi:Methyltransferase domain